MSDAPPPPPRPAPPVPPPPRGSGTGATARGLALIVAAVIVGIVILRATDPSPTFASESRGPVVTPETDAQPEETTPEDGTTTSSTAGEDTTTTAGGDGGDRSDVTVVVANAADGVEGLAGRVAGRIEGAGFTDTAAADADSSVDEPVVYFAPGAEAAAAAVAELFDAAPTVAPLPDPPPATGADLSDAEVVVLATAALDE